MASDTITFILDGNVSLAPFAQAFNSLNNLIVALAAEEGGGKVDWIIEDLAPSSAIVTLRGHSANPEAVERIVRAYESIGYALQYHEPIRRSPRVERPALTIGRLAGTKVKAVRFETAEREAIITSRPSMTHMKRLGHLAPPTLQLQPPFSEQQPGAYGAVEGTVQTLTKRQGLRFTLYDSLNDRAVSCYLAAGCEGIMRNVWGKRAIVQGWVTRDPADGRPLAVRRIHNVTPVTEEGDYRRARAVSPHREGDLLPEERIRRLRDARSHLLGCMCFSVIYQRHARPSCLLDDILSQSRRGNIEIVTSTWSITEVAFAEAERLAGALDPTIEAKIDALWTDWRAIKLVEIHQIIQREAQRLMRDALARGWSQNLGMLFTWRLRLMQTSKLHNSTHTTRT